MNYKLLIFPFLIVGFLTVAGAAFGCMRQLTGSTAAAALMHASYNGLQFVALLSQKP